MMVVSEHTPSLFLYVAIPSACAARERMRRPDLEYLYSTPSTPIVLPVPHIVLRVPWRRPAYKCLGSPGFDVCAALRCNDVPLHERLSGMVVSCQEAHGESCSAEP